MDKFEKYVQGKLTFAKNMLEILPKDSGGDMAWESLKIEIKTQIDTLEDIIHHYDLFVKGTTNDTGQ